jgi:predicted NACHT family NTPase
LDEVPAIRQPDIVTEIVRLSRRYPENRFVVSCRTANYQRQLEGFTEFEIAEFSNEQVLHFVKGWFGEHADLAVSFLSDLKKHTDLAELTTTPLLLALLCIGYRRSQRFPEQRALVYLSCLDALLVDWDSSKQVRRKAFVERFDCESKKQLVAKRPKARYTSDRFRVGETNELYNKSC